MTSIQSGNKDEMESDTTWILSLCLCCLLKLGKFFQTYNIHIFYLTVPSNGCAFSGEKTWFVQKVHFDYALIDQKLKVQRVDNATDQKVKVKMVDYSIDCKEKVSTHPYNDIFLANIATEHSSLLCIENLAACAEVIHLFIPYRKPSRNILIHWWPSEFRIHWYISISVSA